MIKIENLIGYQDGFYKPLNEIGPNILDFGFIHCDSTYDVMPIYQNKLFCFDRHICRFENSAKRYGLKIKNVNYLDIIKNLIKRNNLEISDLFVWFTCWRGTPPSGNPRDINSCPIHFAMYIKPSYSLVESTDIKVYLSEKSLRINDKYFGQTYKNMSWIDLTLAQRNIPNGYDTCVLVDDDNNITEGPGFNVGLVSNNKIYTPRKNCLKGITMSVVEDIATENNLTFLRTDIPKETWHLADEIFLTSTSGGITPVKKGKIVKLLIDSYELKKKDSRYVRNI